MPSCKRKGGGYEGVRLVPSCEGMRRREVGLISVCQGGWEHEGDETMCLGRGISWDHEELACSADEIAAALATLLGWLAEE